MCIRVGAYLGNQCRGRMNCSFFRRESPPENSKEVSEASRGREDIEETSTMVSDSGSWTGHAPIRPYTSEAHSSNWDDY